MKINTNFKKSKDSIGFKKMPISLRNHNRKIIQDLLNTRFRGVLFLILLLFNVNLALAASPIQSINCSFKTFTNGGWGANCHGTNAGCYLETHFATAFPNGLIVGCDRKLKLTTAAAVTEFLPSSGTVNTLPIGMMINPGQTYANTFAGQLVALMLNVKFDAYDSTFAAASGSLGSLVIAQGLFSGWTVNRFLDSANHVIGGCLTLHTLSDWVQTATLINQNFDNGTVDMGFLRCVQPLQLSLEIQATIKCHGDSTGIILSNVSGGVEPYLYQWSNNRNSQNVSDLPAGQYFLTVTDAAGQTVSMDTVLNQPPLLAVTISSTNVSCYGRNNGTASLSIFGGISPYSIEWSNGDTSSQLNNLFAGTDVVTIVDSNGCQAKDSVRITQPELLTVGISSTNVSCFGGNNGTASLNISGGTTPYSILWSTGNTSSHLSGLTAGTYVVTIVDSNGCQSKDSVKITQPELLTLVISSTNVSCYGASDGNASLEIIGGTAPYSILWSNGSDSSVLNNLSIGKYSVTVSDSHGCQSKDSLDIVQPKPLEMIINKSDVACYGGTGEVKPVLNGGTPPYSYELGGNLYQVGNIGSEPIGNWEVHAFDANGCKVNGLVSLSLLSCEGFTTVTQGGWHAKCSGGNWGCTLDRYFSDFFPSGLIIGANSRFLKLTSATAIHNFLPSSGTSRSLNVGTLTNPSSTAYKNTLAGQTVALTLNCIFDANVSSFASSGTLLKDLIIESGLFEGWSVEQVLMEANKALGGMSNYAYTELTSIIDKINSNYDNGLVNNGLLACPCSQQNTLLKSVLNESTINQEKQETRMSIFPNPITSTALMKIEIKTATHATVDLLSVSGQHIQCLIDSDFGNESTHSLEIQTDKLKEGMYVVRLQTENSVETKRIIVLK